MVLYALSVLGGYIVLGNFAVYSCDKIFECHNHGWDVAATYPHRNFVEEMYNVYILGIV